MTERLNPVDDEFFYLPNVRDFSYDPAEQRFVIRNPGYLGIFELRGAREVAALNSKTSDGGRDVVSLEEHTMGLDQYGGVITFPPLRRWIAEMNDDEHREMAEVVNEAMDQSLLALFPSKQKKERGRYDYLATFHPDGRFRLQTPGSCACLGVHINDRGPEGSLATPQIYSLHNIDHPTQALSLYAGAGTIAWLMKQENQ